MSLGEMENTVSTEPAAPAPPVVAENVPDEPENLQAVQEPIEADAREREIAAEATEADADLDEVEYEGEHYRLPKKLKEALLRQADYTRKTQEVAATRKELEARQREIVQQAEAFQADMQERAKLVSLDEQLKEYQNVDWDRWERQDYVAAQSAWRRYQQLQGTRQELAGSLAQKDEQRAFDAQRDLAQRAEEAERVLSREIKGWSPEIKRELRSYGLDQGLADHEVDSIVDPRLIRLLHKAMSWDRHVAGAKTAAPANVKPLQTIVRGKAPATKAPLSKVDDMEEYVRRRKAGERG